MQWTQEQQPIIHSTADKLLVQAFIGTAETTTLVGYTNKPLLPVYGKAIWRKRGSMNLDLWQY